MNLRTNTLIELNRYEANHINGGLFDSIVDIVIGIGEVMDSLRDDSSGGDSGDFGGEGNTTGGGFGGGDFSTGGGF